jgi:hypothetical protein
MNPRPSSKTALSFTLGAVLLLAACRGESAPAASVAPAEGGDNGAVDAAAATATEPMEGSAVQSASLARRSWAEIDSDEALYEPWARVLETYVDEEGLVDYAGLADAGRPGLEAVMGALATTDPSGWNEPRQIAFWINAYNAATVYQVVERYPIDSVRDVGALFGLLGGFFKQPYRIANEDRSVDNIEHDILRPTFNDARIHWTLVCASFGCPRLLRRPYVAADLDALLTEVSFEFMANPRALQIDDAGTTLHVTSYFDWYSGDFEAEAGDIVDYILRYAPDEKAAWIRANRSDIRVQFMDYDWTLNDQSKGPRSRRPVRF